MHISNVEFNALIELAKKALVYKIYTALLSQWDTGHPTVEVVGLNTIGDIKWERLDTGLYVGTLPEAFTKGKTLFFGTNSVGVGSYQTFEVDGGNSSIVVIQTGVEGGGPADSLMRNTPIEIRVYP